jgi:hypothetical protein
VTDLDDDRHVAYRDLKDSALRRKDEAEGGYFLVEGRFALEAALLSSYSLISALVLRRRLHVIDGLPLPPALPVYVANDDVMRRLTAFQLCDSFGQAHPCVPARRSALSG